MERFFFPEPWNQILAAALLALAVWLFVRGNLLIRHGMRNPDHPSQSLWVVRGFRRGITALAVLSFAGGIFYHATWPLWLGVVFLGEELLETGIMILALKSGERRGSG